MALGATWQRHADLRSAYVARIFISYIFYISYIYIYIYINGSSALPIWEGVIDPYNRQVLYTQRYSLSFSVWDEIPGFY